MTIAALGCAVVPAAAQIVRIPPRSTLAYTAHVLFLSCLPCGGSGCDAWCIEYYQTLSVVVTPFGGTGGPADAEPTWSPDATHIAYVSSGDIVLANAAGIPYWYMGTASNESSPAWSPDGRKLAFVSDRDGQPAVYVMNLDGTQVVRLASGGSPTWSPDSARVAFACVVETANTDIWWAMSRDMRGILETAPRHPVGSSVTRSPRVALIPFHSQRQTRPAQRQRKR